MDYWQNKLKKKKKTYFMEGSCSKKLLENFNSVPLQPFHLGHTSNGLCNHILRFLLKDVTVKLFMMLETGPWPMKTQRQLELEK